MGNLHLKEKAKGTQIPTPIQMEAEMEKNKDGKEEERLTQTEEQKVQEKKVQEEKVQEKQRPL